MRIAFTTLPIPSHTMAFTAIAKAVRSYNHQIVCLGFADHELMIRKAGFDFVRVGEKQFPLGSVSAEFAPLSKLHGIAGVEYTYQMLARLCCAVLSDDERALQATGAEALVADTAMKGFDAIAIACGLPYIHVSATVHSDESGYTPIWMYDWLHETGPAALTRNQAGLKHFFELGSPVRMLLREYLDRRAIAVDWSQPYPLLSPIAWLTQIPKELDFPSDQWSPQLRHVGPYFDSSTRRAVDFDWSILTGDTLIYASLGTLQTGSQRAYETIARAAAAPGRRVILSVGSAAQAENLKPLPNNVIAVPFAPQLELLKRASLCISHAGPNTVLEALSFGVPLVAIPVTNDQPGMAARIAYTGSGRFLPFESLNELDLRRMIDEVLEAPQYRQTAKRLEYAINQSGGVRRAGESIHKVLSLPA
jgi:zeaxanthin glucosyltransferase